MTDSPTWPRDLLTLEAWRSLPAETHRRCELVEGTLLVNASPVAGHQRTVLRLSHRLEHALPDAVEVFLDFDLLCDVGPPTLTLFTLPEGGGPYGCAARDVPAVELPGIGVLDLSD